MRGGQSEIIALFHSRRQALREKLLRERDRKRAETRILRFPPFLPIFMSGFSPIGCR